MWWDLSGTIKKGREKTKNGEDNSREAREAKAQKHRDANRQDSVPKKGPTCFDMSSDFNLSLFGEEEDNENENEGK